MYNEEDNFGGNMNNYANEIISSEISNSKFESAIMSVIKAKPFRFVKFDSESFEKKVCSVYERKNHDMVWVNFMNMTKYVPEKAIEKSTVVLDRHNADSLGWWKNSKSGRPIHSLFSCWNYLLVKNKEKKLLKKYDYILSVSEVGMEYTNKILRSEKKVILCPNGTDTEFFSKEEVGNENNNILFCGSLDRFRNIEAIKWFVKNVWHKITKKVKSANFIVVGRNPTNEVLSLKEKRGIEVHPNVPDVRPYYNMSSVSVVPIRYGGGTKLKIFESLSMETPVVCTSGHGLSGSILNALNVADESEKFAEATIKLLGDEKYRKKISKEGKRIVQEEYSWDAILDKTLSKMGI